MMLLCQSIVVLLLVICHFHKVSPSVVNEFEVDANGVTNSISGDNKKGNQDCEDDHPECVSWAAASECEKNPNFMLYYCRKSCQTCDIEEKEEKERKEALKGEWGMPQVEQLTNSDGPEEKKKIQQKLEEMKKYVEAVRQNQTLANVWDECQKSLKHESCLQWAIKGECEKNPPYMKSNCAVACGTCDWLDSKIRCPMGDPEEGVWKPGNLDEFFRNITSKESSNFKEVNILSRPPDGPWVVTIDDFFSQAEANALIRMGTEMGYQRSGGVGRVKKDGSLDSLIISGRTSTNTWCRDKCLEAPETRAVTGRIENLTQVPISHHEHLQLLHYEVGQFYKSHHDYIASHVERPIGVRILTVFLYLNDVEEGGGTLFNNLGITVQPKVGRALIWPSVLDQKPHEMDPQTFHEALPVIRGKKYAANAWLHQRDFQSGFNNKCN